MVKPSFKDLQPFPTLVEFLGVLEYDFNNRMMFFFSLSGPFLVALPDWLNLRISPQELQVFPFLQNTQL